MVMKKYLPYLKYSGITLAILVGVFACDKTIEEPQRVGYTPASVDEKAGTWKTYLLASPE